MAKKTEIASKPETENAGDESAKICGLVMPISAIDGCAPSHWDEVREIISDAVLTKGYKANLVSSAVAVGVIHKRIIQNLYDNPIVVCDVSAMNPNVMFELGIRLAFDKPTVIVKDDMTRFSFDTGGIEHMEYPRDLRYSKINGFKKALAEKVDATFNASKDPEYTTFLKHFSTITAAKIDSRVGTKDDLILEQLAEIREMLSKRQGPRTEGGLSVHYSGFDRGRLLKDIGRNVEERLNNAFPAGEADDATIAHFATQVMPVFVDMYHDQLERGALTHDRLYHEIDRSIMRWSQT